MERGEVLVVGLQFAALFAIVLLISNYTPGQSAQANPVVGSVYWGPAGAGLSLGSGGLTKVSQNQSSITAYFSVAYSTKVSAVSASRLCVDPSSTQGESVVYTDIQFSYDQQRHSSYVVIQPTTQKPGWDCTYTIKVTDDLSQTATWLGSVELQTGSP